MKNQVVLNEEEILEEKILTEKKDKSKALKSVIYLLLGFITGLVPSDLEISPFSAAMLASCEVEYAFLTFIGSCFGYVVSRGTISALRYIIVLIFVLASRIVIEKNFKTLNKKMLSGVFASFFVLSGNLIYMMLTELSLIGIIFSVADAVLCFGISYFYSRSISVPLPNLGIYRISAVDAACIVISIGSLFLCLSSIGYFGFYPVRILACIVIMFSAFYSKIAGGSIAGIILGLVLSFGDGTESIFYMYAVAGLVAGVFSPIGQYALSAAFAVSGAAVMMIFAEESINYIAIIECAVASIAFIAIPRKWLNNAEDYLAKSGFKSDDEVNFQVSQSLETAARTVDEVTDIVTQVTQRMDNIINPEISRVYARIQHNVCTDCEKKNLCWNDSFDSTVKDIQEIAKLRVSNEKVGTDTFNGELATRCGRIKKLSNEIDKDYRGYIGSVDSRLKIDEMRSIVSDQFSSIAQLLYDISDQIANKKIYNENKSRAISAALSESRISVQNVIYYENSYSRAIVEISSYEDADKINHEKIKKIISHTLRKNFKEAEIEVKDFSTVLTFKQRAEYEVKIGLAQIPYENKKICGDCIETLEDPNGNTIAILSDGMGTGKRAAIDGVMTSSIMQKLLLSGFTFNSALRLVNSALLIKSSDESLSTIDALSINTYTAECDFYKAGAAVSFVRRQNEVFTVEKSSLPVGILRNVEFAKDRYTLEKGDIILMVSDGVIGSDDRWIEDTLLAWSTDNMQELATHIADLAKMKNAEKFPDDISVIALKVKKA